MASPFCQYSGHKTWTHPWSFSFSSLPYVCYVVVCVWISSFLLSIGFFSLSPWNSVSILSWKYTFLFGTRVHSSRSSSANLRYFTLGTSHVTALWHSLLLKSFPQLSVFSEVLCSFFCFSKQCSSLCSQEKIIFHFTFTVNIFPLPINSQWGACLNLYTVTTVCNS